MSDRPAYTEYHPRWHRTRTPTLWWLERWTYRAFILRELSSVFVAWFVLFLLLVVGDVYEGRDYLALARNPVVLAMNIVTLFFLVFHAVTWFNLAPQAMVVRLRGQRVPGSVIAAGNYIAWVLVSGFVAWLVLGG
jgi:fumarate reductase subunit C